jgi:hypothetical protein
LGDAERKISKCLLKAHHEDFKDDIEAALSKLRMTVLTLATKSELEKDK